MKFKYYGSNYPADSPPYLIEPINKGEQNPGTYQNRLMISENNLCPTIDWRFRWYDGDEPRWEAFIGDTKVAWLHRGGYWLQYGDIDESDSWEESDDSFFYYVYARILEVCFESCMVDLEKFIIENIR
jgi:hypothetical protein